MWWFVIWETYELVIAMARTNGSFTYIYTLQTSIFEKIFILYIHQPNVIKLVLNKTLSQTSVGLQSVCVYFFNVILDFMHSLDSECCSESNQKRVAWLLGYPQEMKQYKGKLILITPLLLFYSPVMATHYECVARIFLWLFLCFVV